MVTDIFIDGAAELLVQGNFVRVNLVVNSPTERDPQNNPVREVKYQLIMTPQAVTELHRGLAGAINHLTEVGVLTRRDAPKPQTVPEPAENLIQKLGRNSGTM